MFRWNVLCIFIVMLAIGSRALAMDYYVVSEDVVLLEEPKAGAAEIAELSYGDIVGVEPSSQKAFQKISYHVDGRVEVAYLSTKLVRRWKMSEYKTIIPPALSSHVANRYALYFSGVYSKQAQGPRDLETGAETTYKVGEFSGASSFYSFGIDIPYQDIWGFRIAYVMRTVDMEGAAEPNDSATNYRFKLEREMQGLEFSMRVRPLSWRGFGLVTAFELSDGDEGAVTVVEGPAIDTAGVDFSPYVVVAAAVVFDKKLSRHWVIQPGLRYGKVLSTSPMVSLIEGVVSVMYVF